jgi:hypothetical protein
MKYDDPFFLEKKNKKTMDALHSKFILISFRNLL